MRRSPLLFCASALLLLFCFASPASALHVYCGAGIAKAFGEIAEAFTRETGIPVEVTYANAGQIQSQINTAQEGDLFIAGAEEELIPIKTWVLSSRGLVKHLPVLAVARGNPRHIRGLQDLKQEGIRVVLGDGKATPIGKVADKALAEAGLAEALNVVSRGVTAPSIVNALNVGECDAVIVWKENVSSAMEIVPDPALDAHAKIVPAASLSCSGDSEGRERLLEFLGSRTARTLWEKHGYTVLD